MDGASRQFGSDQTADRIAAMLNNGATTGTVGTALGMSRSAVSGIIHRLRQAGDARFAPAGKGLAVRHAARKDQLADLIADGATMSVAGEALGISRWVTLKLWAEIRADLGWQAQ